MDDFLPSPDELYRRLGVEWATRARGIDRGAPDAARSWRDERAATRAPARTTPCMVTLLAGDALQGPFNGQSGARYIGSGVSQTLGREKGGREGLE
jgi:hypothetical protein